MSSFVLLPLNVGLISLVDTSCYVCIYSYFVLKLPSIYCQNAGMMQQQFVSLNVRQYSKSMLFHHGRPIGQISFPYFCDVFARMFFQHRPLFLDQIFVCVASTPHFSFNCIFTHFDSNRVQHHQHQSLFALPSPHDRPIWRTKMISKISTTYWMLRT